MGLLDGKKALIFGVANDHSIAWGIAQALHAQGATIGFSSVESLIERRVRPLADRIGSTFVEPCDVQDDAQIARVFERWRRPATAPSTSWSMRSRSRGARTSTASSSTRRATASRSPSTSARTRWSRLVRAARPLMTPGLERPDAHLLRRREGGRELQRDGRGEGGAGGVRALPRRGPRARRASASTRSRPARSARWPRPASPASSRCTASSTTSRPLRSNITIEDVGGTAVYLASDLSAP